MKNLRAPKDTFQLNADVAGLYPNIPRHAGLKSLKDRSEKKYI